MDGPRGPDDRRRHEQPVRAPHVDDEQRWHELGSFIREHRRIVQLSLRKLSEQAGISNPYLSQIERGLRRPSADILRRIAGALQIPAEVLYVRAGILDEREPGGDLVAEISRDPHLDENQKRTLIRIYESFRSERRPGGGGRSGRRPGGPDATTESPGPS